jgi:broad specificity phosphatase PhoE
MPARLTLLCHGRTTARPSRFPAGEPLASDADGAIGRMVRLLPSPDGLIAAPGAAATETAAAWRKPDAIEPALADLDRGDWAGRSIADVETSEPDALVAWLADPDRAAPGGESRAALRARVSHWLEGQITRQRHTLAVTYPEVVRAALLTVLGAPFAAGAAIDVGPLTLLDLTSDGRRFTLRSFGRPTIA